MSVFLNVLVMIFGVIMFLIGFAGSIKIKASSDKATPVKCSTESYDVEVAKPVFATTGICKSTKEELQNEWVRCNLVEERNNEVKIEIKSGENIYDYTIISEWIPKEDYYPYLGVDETTILLNEIYRERKAKKLKNRKGR